MLRQTIHLYVCALSKNRIRRWPKKKPHEKMIPGSFPSRGSTCIVSLNKKPSAAAAGQLWGRRQTLTRQRRTRFQPPTKQRGSLRATAGSFAVEARATEVFTSVGRASLRASDCFRSAPQSAPSHSSSAHPAWGGRSRSTPPIGCWFGAAVTKKTLALEGWLPFPSAPRRRPPAEPRRAPSEGR